MNRNPRLIEDMFLVLIVKLITIVYTSASHSSVNEKQLATRIINNYNAKDICMSVTNDAFEKTGAFVNWYSVLLLCSLGVFDDRFLFFCVPENLGNSQSEDYLIIKNRLYNLEFRFVGTIYLTTAFTLALNDLPAENSNICNTLRDDPQLAKAQLFYCIFHNRDFLSIMYEFISKMMLIGTNQLMISLPRKAAYSLQNANMGYVWEQPDLQTLNVALAPDYVFRFIISQFNLLMCSDNSMHKNGFFKIGLQISPAWRLSVIEITILDEIYAQLYLSNAGLLQCQFQFLKITQMLPPFLLRRDLCSVVYYKGVYLQCGSEMQRVINDMLREWSNDALKTSLQAFFSDTVLSVIPIPENSGVMKAWLFADFSNFISNSIIHLRVGSIGARRNSVRVLVELGTPDTLHFRFYDYNICVKFSRSSDDGINVSICIMDDPVPFFSKALDTVQ